MLNSFQNEIIMTVDNFKSEKLTRKQPLHKISICQTISQLQFFLTWRFSNMCSIIFKSLPFSYNTTVEAA
jgi:hypothetical protein